MKANPSVQIVSSNQYVGTDVEEAYKRTESILSSYKKPDGSLSIDGIFCANESSSFAAMRVLKDNGWAGKLHFVGFDASDNLIQGTRGRHDRRSRAAGSREDGIPRNQNARGANQG
jgi:ABC-type sugar transport system substrate-binding protein